MGNDTVQPGCPVDEQLWHRFRDNIRERRGRVHGLVGPELERAIRAYLEGAQGGDVTDELRRLRQEVEALRDDVADGGDPPTPSSDPSKEKNSPPEVTADDDVVADADATPDGGGWRDDRHLEIDEGSDDRSVVEKRRDAAIEVLAHENDDQAFTYKELDEAIRQGAGVDSKPSIRKYRDRVFDRLGGREALRHPKHDGMPPDRGVYYLTPERVEEVRREQQKLAEEQAEEAAARELAEEERKRQGEPAASDGRTKTSGQKAEANDE